MGNDKNPQQLLMVGRFFPLWIAEKRQWEFTMCHYWTVDLPLTHEIIKILIGLGILLKLHTGKYLIVSTIVEVHVTKLMMDFLFFTHWGNLLFQVLVN